MNVLVTGGLGYIGSHTCISLLGSGYNVTVLDNLSSSMLLVKDRIEKISSRKMNLVIGDVRDQQCLQELFETYRVTAVLHFAGLKSPFQSLKAPHEYYECNVSGTLTLLGEMHRYGIKTLVFSSSAAVYGVPSEIPVTEKCPTTAPINPYGRSKLMVEKILADLSSANEEWRIACLRYFNPVGAHVSGLIGEDSNKATGNLMPFIRSVASGKLAKLEVFGNDYNTADGTGVRDYIHVQDLADGHISALKYLYKHKGLLTLNLGTGRGVSVLELIKQFEKTSGKEIPYIIMPRRPGDVAECWADSSLAEKSIGWKARLNLEDMCRDTWRWEQHCIHGEK